MFVIKRDGKKEPIMFDKITARIKKLCYGFNDLVDPVRVATVSYTHLRAHET